MNNYSRINNIGVYDDAEYKIIIAPETATWLRCKPEHMDLLLTIPEFPETATDTNLKSLSRLDEYEIDYLLHGFFEKCFIYRNNQLNKNNFICHPKLSAVNTIVFNVTDNCNLRCKYCYADSTKGKNMPFEIIKKTLELVFSQTDNINIQFSGNGEPLLNYKVLLESFKLINQYREKGKQIKISLQTNGVLITGDIARVLKEEVDRTIVSIDGPKEVTDKFRIDTAGKGAFYSIMKGIDQLRDKNVAHELSATIHTYNLFIPVCEWLMENSTGMFAHNYIWPQGRGINYSSNGLADQQIWVRDHVRLMEMLIEYNKTHSNKLSNRTIRQFVTNTVSRKRVSKCHRSACGAGTELISVNALGHIFPCHAMTTPSLKIGDLSELSIMNFSTVFKNTLVDSLREIKVENIDNCNRCDFRHICGGPCCNDIYTRFKSIQPKLPFTCQYKKEFFLEIIRLISHEKENLYHLTGLPIPVN
jgi:uncharacterized protein